MQLCSSAVREKKSCRSYSSPTVICWALIMYLAVWSMLGWEKENEKKPGKCTLSLLIFIYLYFFIFFIFLAVSGLSFSTRDRSSGMEPGASRSSSFHWGQFLTRKVVIIMYVNAYVVYFFTMCICQKEGIISYIDILSWPSTTYCFFSRQTLWWY